MPDRFPEAFDRFEDDVYTSDFRSFQELLSSFAWWSGKRWRGSRAQINALKNEGEKLGFDTSLPFWVKKRDYGKYHAIERRHFAPFERKTWKHETVVVKGKYQSRYRDLATGRFIKKPS